MADIKIPALPVPSPARPAVAPARAEAVAAAQRAFFNAAGTPPPAPPSPPAGVQEAQPQRVPRPGSLLDIKV